jgi:hypothetical protein
VIFIKKHLLLRLYIEYILVLDIYYDCVYIYGTIYFSIKENMMCQDSNEMFNYRIKFKFN